MVRAASLVIALLLSVASVASASTHAAVDAEQHYLLVPNRAPAKATLAHTHARIVAKYPAFTLVQASGADAQALQTAGADTRDDMRRVTVGDHTIDPATQRPRLVPGSGSQGLAVVQFVGPIKDAWLERLRGTSVQIVTYMAQNAYLVHGTASQLAAVVALRSSEPSVRAVVAYTASDKLRRGVQTSGRQHVAIQSLSGSAGSSARTTVSAAAKRTLRGTSAVGPFRTQYVAIDGSDADALAADPGIVAIQPAPRNTMFDERQGQILAGNASGDPLVPTGPGYLDFHEALGLGTVPFGFAVDVTDSGIDEGTTSPVHPDLAGRVVYADDFTTDGDAADCSGHGTLNAGVAGGSNTSSTADDEDAEGFNYDLGIAPRVQVGGSKIFNCAGDFDLVSSSTDLTASAYAKGARISNNSWGCGGCAGTYNADSQEYDALVRDADPSLAGNQEMVEVFAAGNDGPAADTIGTPGNAKNVLTVGASEGVRDSGLDGCGWTDADADDARDIATFSSRGPAPGGRLKPDLVAPGTHITGSIPQHAGYIGDGVCDQLFPLGGTLYGLSTGTSQATPAVAGAAALVHEWYRRNRGAGTVAPSPAMTKAILANAATDLVDGEDGDGGTNANVPEPSQGWGLTNIGGALSSAPRYLRDQEDVLGATGDSRTFVLAVQDAGRPVRITLAYTDAYGPTGADPRVNDIDLTVTSSGGTFKGNVFAGGLSETGGNADDANNLESVYLPAGVTGNLTIGVTATNVAGDGVPSNADDTDQDFALVASNAAVVQAPSAPPAAPVTPGTPATSDGSSAVAETPAAAGPLSTLRTVTQGVVSKTDPKRDPKPAYTFSTTGRIVVPPYCPVGAPAPTRAGGRCVPRSCPAGATSAGACNAPSKAVLCTGVVTVRFKTAKGLYTTSTRSVGLKPDCTFRSKVTFKTPNKLRRGKLKVYTRFQGNPFLLPRDTTMPATVYAGHG